MLVARYWGMNLPDLPDVSHSRGLLLELIAHVLR
jgi:hypothetical protein